MTRTAFSTRRALLRTIFASAWPTMLEQLLMTVVQYADTAMVGHVGASATAAVGVTATTMWLPFVHLPSSALWRS